MALVGGCSSDGAPSGGNATNLPTTAVRFSVCTGQPAVEVYNDLVWALATAGPMQRVAIADGAECVRRAADCPAVLACLGMGERCDAESTRSACEGDTTRTSCSRQPNGEGYVVRVSCPDVGGPGAVCRMAPNEDEDIRPTCVGAACEEEGASRCEGDFVVECIGGYERRRACAPAGQTCLEIDEGVHVCGEAAACGGDACVDGVALLCDRESRVSHVYERLDCKVFSPRHECLTSVEGPQCAPQTPDPACAGNEARESCDGAVIRACLGGMEVALDCATFGAVCATAPVTESGFGLRCRATEWP